LDSAIGIFADSQLRQIPKTEAKPGSRVSTPMLAKFGLIG
jgi:hypothetical protein